MLFGRMFNSRWQIMVSLILITSMGYYIFSYFQENQQLAYEMTGYKMKLKRSMSVISRYEKKYKTSHNNEQLFAQSNKDLQMNIAKQERQLFDVTAELDKEKTKLAEAYLFYTYMKDLCGVTGELQNSFERKVESAVVDALKEKASEWKSASDNYELLKKNHSQLLTKHTELNNTLETLHVSHRSLQRTSVKNTNEYSDLKKMYNDLLIKNTNVTNLYTMQLAIDTKLQKQLNNYKTVKTIEFAKKLKQKKKLKKVKVANEDGSDQKKQVTIVEENKTEHTTKSNEKSMIKKTGNIVKSKKDVASNSENETKVNTTTAVTTKPISTKMSVVTPTKINPKTNHINLEPIRNPNNNKTITPVSQVPIIAPIRHKNTNLHVKPNKTLHQSVKNFLKSKKNSKLSHNKSVSTLKHIDNRTVHTPMKNITTIAKPTKETVHSKADEVDEYIDKEKENDGIDFDEEEKHDPPHIADILDANGLSVKASAD